LADRDELERAFRRLPVDQRAVFVLHHYVGLPLVEIAELLEIPAGTARSRLH
jgi:RNA polymerase sigma factor (sigma-70 family)